MSGIPIRSAIDITTARNVLRRRISTSGYTPTFRARAAATLTALAEFVIASKKPGMLDMISINRANRKGFEFHSRVNLASCDFEPQYEHLTRETTGIADEIELVKGTDHFQIVARVWLAE